MLEKALSLHRRGQLAEAASLYRKVLARNPKNADALHLLGVIEFQRKNPSAAIELIDRAIKLGPNNAGFFSNRGLALAELNRLDDALTSYDRALAIKPDYADALYNRGNALRALERFDEALASYNLALAIKPNYAEALNNRGLALAKLKRFDDALVNCDRALAIRPDYVEALTNRGDALRNLKRPDDALASYARALAIKPDHAFLLGMWLLCKMSICDWSRLTDDFRRLAEKIDARQQASTPFPLLAMPLSAALQRRCSEIYVKEKYPQSSLLPKCESRYEHDRIRLGYFSADFYDHATARLMAELFERHDRTLFELIAFSFGPVTKDAMRARLERSFDRFIEVGGQSDRDVALLARSLEIDIAVDLKGFTQHHRVGIFAMGAAPIQVNYLGYPGTTGADYINYIIADSTLVPEEFQRHYAEKIAYLPHTYQVNDPKRLIAEKRFTRAECGLPEDAFVFSCFNNNYKILPEIFDIWLRLLNRVEGSVLWLLHDNSSAAINLSAEAKARGVAPERLVFAKRMALPEHLSRHRLADVFLDTIPCNAHTTASDALWAGLPVLTCLGETFAGRVAASLLNAVGLPELITHNLDEYEALALELATNPKQLLLVRQTLAANRLTHPLFDIALFIKHIESAYVAMWKRHQAGLAPEHIYVPSET